ncbi:UDP-N-acetylglucosamine transferase subunit ALG14 homolog [Tachysurus ichikawai]
MIVSASCAVLCGVFMVVIIFLLRLITVLRSGAECKPATKGSVCVVIVAGSGGHTSEIIRLMGSLSLSYTPRHYVIADTDKMSEEKIRTFEASKEKSSTQAQFTIHRIPRSREVRQSWSSSVLSTLYAQLYSLPLVFRLRPDMPVSNCVKGVRKSVQKQESKQMEESEGGGVEVTHCLVLPSSCSREQESCSRVVVGTDWLLSSSCETEKREEERDSIGFL